MLFEHEYYSVEDILRVASKAEGKEVGCFDINGRLKVNGNKGQIGHVMICTHFPGHILFTSLNTWMLPCILQGASILFFSESFYYCNS